MSTPRDRIRFHVAHTPAKAAQYVMEALDANENVNGSFTRRCSEFLEDRYEAPRVLITHSATAALEMSAMVLAAVHGADRVSMPSYTFPSTASAFVRAGYSLDFIDIDPETMTASLADVAYTSSPANSVVVPVHYAGNPGEIDRIVEWARDRGVWVVEDAAQALGGALDGKGAGTFGVLGAISFHFTKSIHSSMGGALFINDPDLIETATFVWERGTNRQAMLKGLVDKYSWVELGSSFQGSEIQAAFLLASLEEYEEVIEHRRELWLGYADRLGSHESEGLFIQRWRPEALNNYHAFFIRLDSAGSANAMRNALLDQGMELFIGYVPLHTSPYGRRRGFDKPLPQTERWAECILRLPLHTGMDVDDMERVSSAILDWLDSR